ncbi:MAG: hypothetical protein D6705_15765 [Deltaproteobacteria bacterium]|nr:MAG: hypothetical protein D6705_15765 [Deltaproteobacteria bacterium]
MRRDDEPSGLLPEIEPDEPSTVRPLPGGGGAPVPPPPGFAGRPQVPATPPAPAPPAGDPTQQLASKLSEVTAGIEPALVDLAGDEHHEEPPPPVATVPASAPTPDEPRTAEAPTPAGPTTDDGPLELDFDRAGIAPKARGQATPEAPGAGDPTGASDHAPGVETARPSVSPRSPDVRPAPDPWWAPLVRDPAARALAAAAVGLLLALPVAYHVQSRAQRDLLGPLLAELETSADRPLAARAGTLRTVQEIRREIDDVAAKVRTRFWGVFVGGGALLGVLGFVALGRLADRI